MFSRNIPFLLVELPQKLITEVFFFSFQFLYSVVKYSFSDQPVTLKFPSVKINICTAIEQFQVRGQLGDKFGNDIILLNIVENLSTRM